MNFEKEHKDWQNKKDYLVAMITGQLSKPDTYPHDLNYENMASLAAWINDELLPEPAGYTEPELSFEDENK